MPNFKIGNIKMVIFRFETRKKFKDRDSILEDKIYAKCNITGW